MDELYGQLPSDLVRQGHDLYQNFADAIGKDKKGRLSAKVTDLFLVNTGHGLEFVQKKSAKSFWLGFVHSVKKLIGKEDETFDFSKNLEVASRIIATSTQADDKFFDQIAKEMSETGVAVDGQTLRRNLYELGIHLRSMQRHVVESRSLKGKSIKPIDIKLYKPEDKVSAVASRYCFKTADEFSARAHVILSNALPDLSDNEKEQVIACLIKSPDAPKALADLAKKPKSDTSCLHLILLKAQALCTGQQSDDVIHVLQKLEPQPEAEKADPKKLKYFAMLFADAFIHESGFEGEYSTRPFVDLMVEFIKDKAPSTPVSKKLLSVLESFIDLREASLTNKQLVTDLQEKLKTNDRCILLGGWSVHALVYEIERQTNGKYTVRIFNEGSGVDSHDQLESKFKSKFKACIALKDIPEHILFDESRLGMLRAFTTMPKEGLLEIKPEEFLVKHLIPMLDGKKEATDPRLTHFLSPQRSGTCTFRSLAAFIAHTLSHDEYKQFKFHFKLYQLDQYLPDLKAAAQTDIPDTTSYEETRRQYNVLKRSMEKYANGMKKMSQIMPDRDIAEAEKRILQYNVYLKQLELRIHEFEQKAYTTQIGALTSQAFQVQAPVVSAITSPSTNQDVLRVLEKIDKLKRYDHEAERECYYDISAISGNDDDTYLFLVEIYNKKTQSTFIPRRLETIQTVRRILAEDPSQIESTLSEIARNVEHFDEKTLCYVVDSVYRKLGSVHAFDAITYDNPQQACKDLQIIATRIGGMIEKKELQSRANLRGMFLFTCYGLENALKQLPENERIVPEKYLGILKDHPSLYLQRTSDSFWNKAFADIQEIVRSRPPQTALFRDFLLLDVVLTRADGTVKLDPQLTKAVITWWESGQSQELRSKVQASIAEDRKNQQEQIEHGIRQAKMAIEHLKGELESTDKKDKKRISEIKSEIERRNNQIAQIPDQVKNNPSYWPHGFEIPAAAGGMSDESKAAFFFAQNPPFFTSKIGSDILPEHFRTYCATSILCGNIFEKNKIQPMFYLDPLQMVKDGYSWSTENKVIKRKQCDFQQRHLKLEDDVYVNDLSDDNVKKMYNDLFSERHEETHIPHQVSLTETRLAPGSIERDELTELFALRATKEVQLEAVLNYFKENPDKLKSNDWMNVLHSLLFESDLLVNEFSDEERTDLFVEKARDFFSTTIKSATLVDDFEQAANLLWIANSIEQYGNVQIVDPQTVFELFDKVSAHKYAVQWPMVFEAMLASLAGKLTDTQEENKLLALALVAHCMYSQNPASSTTKSQLRIETADLAKRRIQELLSETPLSDDFVNFTFVPFLSKIYPELESITFKNLGHNILLADDKTLVRLGAGRIVPSNPEAVRVYSQNLSADEILFLRTSTLYKDSEDVAHLRAYKEGALTYIHDPAKNLYIACDLADQKLWIKQPPEPWSKFMLPKEKEAIFTADVQLVRAHHVLQKEGTMYFVDPNTFTVVYELSDDKTLSTIEPPPLQLAWKIALRASFSSFEALGCTSYFVDETEAVKKITFPRLNLTLQQPLDSTIWNALELPGWHVAEEQFLPNFGQSTGFLLLENDEGKKKALIPVWKAVKVLGEKHALNFPYVYDFEEATQNNGHYVECDVVGTTLVPKSTEALFYLTEIYLEKGFDDLAETLLNSPQAELSSRKLSVNERTQLERIVLGSFSKDESSRTILLRMRALVLLEKNDTQFPEKSTKAAADIKTDLLSKLGLVELYYNRMGHIVQLLPKDEILFLRAMTSQIDEVIENLKDTEAEDKIPEIRAGLDHAKMYILKRLAELESGAPLLEKTQMATTTIPQAILSFSTTATEEHVMYKPTPEDTMTYFQARAKHEFPFNPQNVTEEEMKKYFNLLNCEVTNLCNTWNISNANKSGLLPLLYYLVFFNPDPKVQQDAKYLITQLNDYQPFLQYFPKILPTTYKPHTFERHKGDAYVTKKVLDKDKIPVIDLGLMTLLPVNASEHATSTSTRQLDDYFTKSAKEVPAGVDPNELFDPDCPEAKDDATKAAFREIAHDMQVAQEQLAGELYTVKDGIEIDQILTVTKDELAKESELLAHHERVIVESIHQALISDRNSFLEFTSKKRTLPTIQELAVLSAKKDFRQRVKTLYPELSDTACEQLQEAMKQYLVQKGYVLRLARRASLATDILQVGQADPELTKSLVDQLGKSFDTKLAYTLEDPLAISFLLFESILDVTLRADQVNNIRSLALSIATGKPVAYQAIMGAGKTSIFQPLLAFIFAEPGVISTVMVPEPLFEPVREGLVAALGSAFHTSVLTLFYDRTKSTDVTYLKTYVARLEEAKERGSCVLMTPRIKHSIITSLYEAYHDYEQNPSPQKQDRIEQITSIASLMQLDEVVQIDEIDASLNPKIIFKYPIGHREVIDTERATIVSELLLGLSESSEVANKVSIDFMKTKGKVSLTRDLYTTVVQPELVLIASKLLSEKDPLFKKLFAPGYDTEQYLRYFLTQTTPYDDAIETLCLKEQELKIIETMPQTMKELEKVIAQPKSDLHRLIAQKLIFNLQMKAWINKEIPEKAQAELLGALSQAISEILPYSLLRECGVHYGADLIGKKYVARPYDAANSPKPTQFSNPYEQVIFSTQLALYSGVPVAAAHKMLTDLQTKAKEEMTKNSCPLIETESYMRYAEIMGDTKDLFSFMESPISNNFLRAFHAQLSSNPKWIQLYLKGYVYNQIVRYNQSVSSTPKTLVGSSNTSCGYTGTPEPGILPSKMECVLEIGTDGRTINAVESKKPVVEVIVATKEKTISDQLIDKFVTNPQMYVFTDSGGWLKDVNIEEYTLKLFTACETRAKAVAYHDIAGVKMSLERNASGQLIRIPLSQSRFKTENGDFVTIIQQKYETGTNIPQPAQALFVISIRKGMTKRDLLQSIFRARKILAGQNVSFVISDEVKHDIASGILNGLLSNSDFYKLFLENDNAIEGLGLDAKLTKALKAAFQEMPTDRALSPRERNVLFLNNFTRHLEVDSKTIWRYVAANLDQEKFWLASTQSMREVVEAPLRRVLLDKSLTLPDRLAINRALQSLVLATETDSPFTHMMSGALYLDAQAATDRQVAHFHDYWKQLSFTGHIQQKIDQQVLALYGKNTIESELRGCVDIKSLPRVIRVSQNVLGQELEQEEELQNEEEVQRQIEIEQQEAKPEKKSYVPLVATLSQFFTKQFSTLQKVLPKGIFLVGTEELYYSPNLFLDSAPLGSSKHGMYHLPGRFLLAIIEPDKPRRYLLVSHEDAARIKKGIYSQKVNPPQALALYSFDGKIVATTNRDIALRCEDEKLQRALLLAKVVTGKTNYKKEELELLATMMPTTTKKRSMHQMYESIIKYLPASAKRYMGSNLETQFSAAA